MSAGYAGVRRSLSDEVRDDEEQRKLSSVEAINRFYRFQPAERNKFSLKLLARTMA